MPKNLFEKGNPGKPKGTPNKLTQSARELFLQTLEAQVPHIHDAFDKVRRDDPDRFLELFAKYAQYFVPKQMDLGLTGKLITVVVPPEPFAEDVHGTVARLGEDN